VDKFDLLVVL